MSIFHEIAETGDECGHCKGCRWWQAEHEESMADASVIGLCMQPELTHFSIQVSGQSGCNRFEHAQAGAGLVGAVSGV